MACANRPYRVYVFTYNSLNLAAVLLDATITHSVTGRAELAPINSLYDYPIGTRTGMTIESNHAIDTLDATVDFMDMVNTTVTVNIQAYDGGALVSAGSFLVEEASYNLSGTGHTGRMRLTRQLCGTA